MSSATDSQGRWWHDAVVYQVYPRSFQDTSGDGVGDLRGVTRRLDHLEWLGVDALWLSPIYPSPFADMGYDISDFTAVDPRLGTLDDLDRLVAEAHRRGIRVLLDLVPCHSSIEHPWFREHPERYVWSRVDGPENNWLSAFGGPAWSRDPHSRGWYLHSFYPEQPDLDWRKAELREAFAEVVRFWLGRGVDGFRLDALQGLLKDTERRDDPPARRPFELPLDDEHATLEHRHSQDAPDVALALEAIRAAAGDAFLVGEVYLPSSRLAPYLEQLDLAFSFELLHSPWRAERLEAAIGGALAAGGAAWVLSNHDFPRIATRLGSGATGLAALLLLTLPGIAFVYQGDEIGLGDGPGAEPPLDRRGRDAHRHPMQWSAGPGAGFSEGRPWLAPVDPRTRNVELQRQDPASLLHLYRRLIGFRKRLSGAGIELVEAASGLLAYRRGNHAVVLNLGDGQAPIPATLRGTVEIAVGTSGEGQLAATVAAGGGLVTRLD